MTNQVDVIVVGGGLAGLAAASTAAAGGASTVVLEAHHPGGRARTTRRGEFVFNHGAHALYVGGPGRRVLAELGVRPHGEPPPLARYRALADGRLHLLPTGPASLLRSSLLGLAAKAQLARVLAGLGRSHPADVAGRSTAEWLAGFGLRPRAETLMRALVRLGTYCADLDAMSADVAVSQLKAAAAGGVLYLHGGWALLVEALAAPLDVRGGVKVARVEPSATGVAVHTDSGTFTAAHVVVAAGTPASAASVLEGPAPWPDQGEPVTAACLDVGVRGVPVPGYVLGLDEPLYGTTQSPPARQAPAGMSVVGVVRYGATEAAADRARLEAMLEHVGVTADAVVTSRFLARMTVAGSVPRPDRGGMGGRPGVDAGHPRLSVAGDWVGSQGILADAALASGHAAGLRALSRPARETVAA